MTLNSAPFDVSQEWGSGLTATNAMTVAGIKSTSNLLAVISIADSGGLVVGRDISDFTAGDGTLTAGTIDLSSTKFLAIWTDSPSS